MKLNPFQWFDIISGKKKVTVRELNEFLSEGYEQFMINRIFSNDSRLLQCASILNKSGFTNRMHFEMARAFYKRIYGNKSIYIPYAKGTPVPKEAKMLAEYFDVSEKHALRYYEIIDKEELQEIKNYYKQIDEFKKRQKIR